MTTTFATITNRFNKKISLLVLSSIVSISIFAATPKPLVNAPAMGITPSKYTISDFQKSADKSNFQVSPDGLVTTYLKNDGKNIQLYAIPENGKVPFVLTANLPGDVVAYSWKANDKIVIEKSTSSTESVLYYISTDLSVIKDISIAKGTKNKLVDLQKKNPEALLVSNGAKSNNANVYKINLKTFTNTLVASNPGNVTTWICDNTGTVRVGYGNIANKFVVYKSDNNNTFNKVYENDYKETIIPLAFDGNSKDIMYCASNITKDRYVIGKYNINTQVELATVFEDPMYTFDVKDVIIDQNKQEVIGVSYTGVNKTTTFIKDDMNALLAELSKKVGNYKFEVLSFSDDYSRILVREFNEKNKGMIALYNSKTRVLDKLIDFNTNKNLLEDDLVNTQFVKLNGANRKLTALLTMPKVGKKHLPAIILLKNSAISREAVEYNSLVQYYASKGFVIMQVNYSGTIGMGRELFTNGFKNWQEAFASDVNDAVNYLVNNEISNNNQIAVMGTGLGAYAALCSAVSSPDRLPVACAVAIGAPLNLSNTVKEMMNNTAYASYAAEAFGNPDTDADLFAKYDLSLNAAKINTPLFFVQGGKDTKSTQAEVTNFINVVKNNAVEIGYIYKAEEGATFKNIANIKEVYTAIDLFLAKQIEGTIVAIK